MEFTRKVWLLTITSGNIPGANIKYVEACCFSVWQYDRCDSMSVSKGIARTQSPTNKNYALELPAFGVIVGVSPTVVQWRGLTLEEPPSWSRFTSEPGKYAQLANMYPARYTTISNYFDKDKAYIALANLSLLDQMVGWPKFFFAVILNLCRISSFPFGKLGWKRLPSGGILLTFAQKTLFFFIYESVSRPSPYHYCCTIVQA